MPNSRFSLPARLAAALVFSVAIAGVTGCAGTSKQEGTGEYISDSWITTKVKTALFEDSKVKATEVNVETYKGAVQLSGFVSAASSIDEAGRVARGVKGVTSVKNDIRLK